jgi:hypothetical protein
MAETTTASVRTSGRAFRRAQAHTRASGSAGGSFRDVIGTVADRGNLTQRQIAAGDWLYNLLNAWGGTTGGLIAGYGERISGSAPGPRGQPSGWTAEFLALQHVLDKLPTAQRKLLHWLVTYAERPTGRRSLQYYIVDVLGLDVARTYAVPMAVGHVQALLETVADLRAAYVASATSDLRSRIEKQRMARTANSTSA